MYGIKPLSGNNWRALVADIDRLRQDVNEAARIVPNMKVDFERDFQFQRDRVYPVVARGILGEYQAAIEKVQAGQARIERARQAEAKRWDFAKLHGEIEAISGMVRQINSQDGVAFGGSDKSERLRALFGECMDSGDIHRQRAAAQVFSGLDEMPLTGQDRHGLPIRRAVVDLVVVAKAKTAEIRTTGDLAAAAGEVDTAIDELLGKRGELRQAAIALGVGDPSDPFSGGDALSRAYRLVGVENGRLTIRAADDWHVTGVSWERMNSSEVAK